LGSPRRLAACSSSTCGGSAAAAMLYRPGFLYLARLRASAHRPYSSACAIERCPGRTSKEAPPWRTECGVNFAASTSSRTQAPRTIFPQARGEGERREDPRRSQAVQQAIVEPSVFVLVLLFFSTAAAAKSEEAPSATKSGAPNTSDQHCE